VNQEIEKFILQASSKALATRGENGINVVPVSSIRVVDGEIWLINYFMDKTLINILETKEASLVCWEKMFGYQIKGEATYLTEGDKFQTACDWIKEILPDRTVKGLVILKPIDIFDVSPSKNTHEFKYNT